MAKLFPPLVDGTIPAFYSENGTVKITVPFSLNRTVSALSVSSIALKVKTAQSSTYLYTVKTAISSNALNEANPQVAFNITDSDNKFKVGQYYKFQIAFIDNTGAVGYYSTVAVGKYTTLPEITINGFDNAEINGHTYSYIGRYSQEDGDTTEKVSTYCFNLYDSNDNILYTSGEQLHNSAEDTSNKESTDTWQLLKELDFSQSYSITYSVITINGLEVFSPKYKISQKPLLASLFTGEVKAIPNPDNGFIAISLAGIEEDETITGDYYLERREIVDGKVGDWDIIGQIRFTEKFLPCKVWNDYTVEQGKTYQYAIQQFNKYGLYANQVITDIVSLDFEHMFLYDGKRQLCIKFNPKIANFKKDLLEAKTDTIGNQFPYILRNGRTDYKEFSISGLISYLADEQSLFYDNEEYLKKSQIRMSTPAEEEGLDFSFTSTSLSEKNFKHEREFKHEVYNWLTNGEPKLFRSPSEGNYIVRLMNVSMTPTDSLSRMLHTFTGTAYEIAKFDVENLNEYGFIVLESDIEEISLVKSAEISLATNVILNSYTAQEGIYFSYLSAGDVITLTYATGEQEKILILENGERAIETTVPITSIVLTSWTQTNGAYLEYWYYPEYRTSLDNITDIYKTEVPLQQFIGEHNITEEINGVYDDSGKYIENPKIMETNLIYYKVYERPKVDIYRKVDALYYDKDSLVYYDTDEVIVSGSNYYADRDCSEVYDLASQIDTDLYAYHYTGSLYPDVIDNVQYYEDINSGETFQENKLDRTLQTSEDGKTWEILYDAETWKELYSRGESEIIVDCTGVVNRFKTGNGLIFEIGYQQSLQDYEIEENLDEKIKYERALENWQSIITNPKKSKEEIAVAKETLDRACQAYIIKLNKVV